MVESEHASPALTPSVLRRLLLAKGFLERGEALCRSSGALDGMIAIHHLHLSLEITVRALYSHLGMELPKRDGFAALLSDLQGDNGLRATGRELPQADFLQRINKERNLVQHDARPVTRGALSESAVLTREFLRQTFPSFFGMELEDLSELDFVADENLRKLIAAGRALATLQTPHAIALGIGALAHCLDVATASWPQHRQSVDDGAHFRASALGEVSERVQALEEEVALLATGVSALEHRWLRGVGPSILIGEDGSLGINTTGVPLLTAEDYWRAERFVIGCILSWQELLLNPRYTQGSVAIQHFADVAAVLSQRATAQ